MKNGNNDIFCYDHNCQPLPLSDTMPYTGIQSWIENNNKMIYTLLISNTEETRDITPGTRIKMIQQLEEQNRALRILRTRRIADKLINKLEYSIDMLMENDYENDAKYLPVYMQLLTSIQEATEKIETPNTEQSTLLFDTVKDEAETDLPEESREKIRNTAQELLKLCTARGALPKAETVSEGDE